ncbi:hypothetical protein DFJ58DRAFT_846370, partial [Suillus subalutaceus]|uniref:uncharacterized protein n=1 Tax=Suillus subalutaceus TaxID=48586 RepID=UPI001B8646E4
MIAAAAVVAIFVLSGDKDLYAKGEKSNILYQQYHNYYRQRLMTGGAWARDITNFFNNALFPETSSSHATLDVADTGTSYNSWEEELERAMEEGGYCAIFLCCAPAICLCCAPAAAAHRHLPLLRTRHLPLLAHPHLLGRTYQPTLLLSTTPETLPPVSATAPVVLHSPGSYHWGHKLTPFSAMQDLALAGEAIVVGAIPPSPKPSQGGPGRRLLRLDHPPTNNSLSSSAVYCLKDLHPLIAVAVTPSCPRSFLALAHSIIIISSYPLSCYVYHTISN